MSRDTPLAISAGTLSEAMIVAGKMKVRASLERLIARLKPEIVPVTAVDAYRVGEAYEHWGKGAHAARLNFGDCFAYVLAIELGQPLLYVGDEFSKTDVVTA